MIRKTDTPYGAWLNKRIEEEATLRGWMLNAKAPTREGERKVATPTCELHGTELVVVRSCYQQHLYCDDCMVEASEWALLLRLEWTEITDGAHRPRAQRDTNMGASKDGSKMGRMPVPYGGRRVRIG